MKKGFACSAMLIPCRCTEDPGRHKLRCASEGRLSDSWAEIERQLDSSRSTRNGHFAGRHELLLYGVELDHRKADSRVRPLSV